MAAHHKFGAASLRHLSGVRLPLYTVTLRALEICRIDISAVDGLRTFAEQRENIKNGVSWTMKSRHLPDATGLAGADDLYPYVGGKTSHADKHYVLIARAMFAAAMENRTVLEWGGFWPGKYYDPAHWQLADHVPVLETP